MEESQKRVKKIFEYIDSLDSIKTKPDAVILANGTEPHLDASFFYITGFPYGLFEGSYLLGFRNGEVSLITSRLEEPIANAYAKGINVYSEPDAPSMKARLGKLVRRESIGINSSELTYRSFEEIKSATKHTQIVNASQAFERARLIKDATEVSLIQKACDISSAIWRKIPKMLKEGVTENEIAAKMAYEMQREGGTGLAFESIIAFGKNSTEPHYSPGQVKLKRGQFVLCDYGTRYRRYCSDITRTLVFGSASKKQSRMYEIVKEALELGTDLCTTDNTGKYVHSKVEALINSTEYQGRFIHSTGHSLGLSVHDGPGLSKNYDKKLEPGMVITVEPGIYVQGFGGVRIEDDVLITKGKPRVLTTAARELVET